MASSNDPLEGIPLSKINPKFLHSNSTSHVWAFGAIAELIDNAYDPDVAASHLRIDMENIDGKSCLVFTDNGTGMNREKLLSMLSFGYCDKESYNDKEGRKPVGLYGNGFKSGSMRLGKDVIVITRQRTTACIGLLSQSYLHTIDAESIIVPIIEYSLTKINSSSQTTKNNLFAILQYSLFNTELQLKDEIKSLEDSITGTKIIIYNLEKLQDGRKELDFVSVPDDIRCPVSYRKDTSDVAIRPLGLAPEYMTSLRVYCSILYQCPKMKIILRGKLVKTKYISKSLHNTDVQMYRPSWFTKKDKPIKVTFGFSCEKDSKINYGFMLYHKNRLIKPYEKLGCQKQNNEKGISVIGVAEVNCLVPTHNKQDFERNEHYNTVMNTLATKLNNFWSEFSEQETVINDQILPDWTWVQCDRCMLWRRLPSTSDPDKLPENWYCHMNEDAYYNRCFSEEESDHKETEYKSVSKLKGQKKKVENSRKKRNTQDSETDDLEEGTSKKTSSKKLILSPSNKQSSDKTRRMKNQLSAAKQSNPIVNSGPSKVSKNLLTRESQNHLPSPAKKSKHMNDDTDSPEKSQSIPSKAVTSSDKFNKNSSSPKVPPLSLYRNKASAELTAEENLDQSNTDETERISNHLRRRSIGQKPSFSKFNEDYQFDGLICNDDNYSSNVVESSIKITEKRQLRDKAVQTEEVKQFHKNVYHLLQLLTQKADGTDGADIGEIQDIEETVETLLVQGTANADLL